MSALPRHEAWIEFESLCRRAMQCRECFRRLPIDAPTIDIAQPRWIGPRYWTARRRILAVMTNPGSGENRIDGVDASMRMCLARVRDGQSELWPLLAAQREDMAQNWHRFVRFFDGLELAIDEVAFANIAWCATKGNKYPIRMLDNCFERHTKELVRILEPKIILLLGSPAHKFGLRIGRLLENARLIKTLHFSHRKGRSVEQKEWSRVRQLLKE